MLKTNIMLNFWILQMVAMALTALLIPKLRISSVLGVGAMVAALSFVNATIWDSQLFTSIPSAFTTQAFSLFVANGLIFWILVKVLPGIEVEGFIPALFAPIVFTLCSFFVNSYGANLDWREIARDGAGVVSSIRDTFLGANPESPEGLGKISKPGTTTSKTKVKKQKAPPRTAAHANHS